MPLGLSARPEVRSGTNGEVGWCQRWWMIYPEELCQTHIIPLRVGSTQFMRTLKNLWGRRPPGRLFHQHGC